MKAEKKILIAFLLNIAFSVFEMIGGVITGSVAIVSDSVHDFGDALSIGIAYFLERKSKRKPDAKCTYGYARYSVLGAVITTAILIAGSGLVVYGGVRRLIEPADINYDGMIIFAVVGTVVNFIAAYCTRDGENVNQKSVNLHMLEDVLGWIVVLAGAILMKFTNINVIDALMSIGVAIFILVHALENLKDITNLFLEKTPEGISIQDLTKKLESVNGVKEIHHVHVWSMDGTKNYATLHIKTASKNPEELKCLIRKKLAEGNITHVTIELEGPHSHCAEEACE